MSVLNDSHPLWKEFNETSDVKTTHNHFQHHRHLHDHFRGSNSKIRSNQDMSLKVLNVKFGFNLASKPACEMIEQFIRPRAARNSDLIWRHIVNEDVSQLQQVGSM